MFFYFKIVKTLRPTELVESMDDVFRSNTPLHIHNFNKATFTNFKMQLKMSRK